MTVSPYVLGSLPLGSFHVFGSLPLLGSPKRRFMDAVREDMQVAGVREEDTEIRSKWKAMIRAQPLKRDKQYGKEDSLVSAIILTPSEPRP